MAPKKEPVTNTAGTHVWMAHPGISEPWACPVDFVKTAQERGWTYADAPGAAVTAEGTAQTGFDPAQHDVDVVNAHLVKHLDAPGEIERVLLLERDGKDRKTVVDPREPEQDPADVPDAVDPNSDQSQGGSGNGD